MWSRDQKAALGRRVRSVLAIGSTALLAACFQPLYNLTGGAGAVAPTHRLRVRMSTSRSALIVDPNTGRTEAEITGIDVKYTLTELATGRPVVTGTAFTRVSSDIPGQQQRFAHLRGLRDAEDRAAKVIA